VGITIFIIESWTGKINKGGNFIPNTLMLIMLSFIGSFLTWVFFPLVIVLGLLFLINKFLCKWGNNYRKLAKSKEKRLEEILKDMLDSDPIFREKYNELIKNTPEI